MTETRAMVLDVIAKRFLVLRGCHPAIDAIETRWGTFVCANLRAPGGILVPFGWIFIAPECDSLCDLDQSHGFGCDHQDVPDIEGVPSCN